jgi:hypothetical protein
MKRTFGSDPVGIEAVDATTSPPGCAVGVAQGAAAAGLAVATATEVAVPAPVATGDGTDADAHPAIRTVARTVAHVTWVDGVFIVGSSQAERVSAPGPGD